jgi:hypothetical protein
MGAGATGTRGGPGATLSREAGAGALGHADTRTHLAFCFDLELVREGTRSSREHVTEWGAQIYVGAIGHEKGGAASDSRINMHTERDKKNHI